MNGPPALASITGLGAITSLGGVVQAAAAHRAGLSRARELSDWPYFTEESYEPLLFTGHPALPRESGFDGAGRLIKLASEGVADLRRNSDLDALDLSRVGLVLVLPEGSSEMTPPLLDRIALRTGLSGVAEQLAVEGRCSAVTALNTAAVRLGQTTVDAYVVGAVDSWLDTERLTDLVESGSLTADGEPAGMFPGEAACFLLLRRVGDGAAMGHLQAVSGIAAAPGSEDYEPDGDGLAAASGQVLTAMGVNGAGAIYSDLNGERWRATDFGNALVRTCRSHPVADWPFEAPAISFGDTGVATGILAACLAVRSFQRGYAHADRVLITLASDRAEMAAIGIRR